MRSRLAYFMVAFVVTLTDNTILRVNGQPTVHDCENEDSSIGIVAEANYQRQNEQVQQIHEFHNASFQEIRRQLDAVMTSLQEGDRRTQNLNVSFQQMKNQLYSVVTSLQEGDRRWQGQMRDMQYLNVSFQQMKTHQDSVVTRLEEGDRRSQEQMRDMQYLNVSFQQMKDQLDSVVTSLQEVIRRTQNLNVSFQQMKNQLDSVVTRLQEGDRRSQEQIRDMANLNVSFHQMKNQLGSVLTSLEAIDLCLLSHNTSNNNRTQTEVAAALETDLEEGAVPLPTVNNWTILMHRFDGSLNFNRSWVEYRNGFGDIGRGEFWLGNEKIYRLTNTNGVVHTLRLEVQHNTSGQWYYADYDTFSIDSESNKYTLHLSGYSGNAGDSLTDISYRSYFLDGMNFSTFDKDYDRGGSNCAMSYEGGWWFNHCHHACLTCSYNYFMWYRLSQFSSDGSWQLRAARMMVKSN